MTMRTISIALLAINITCFLLLFIAHQRLLSEVIVGKPYYSGRNGVQEGASSYFEAQLTMPPKELFTDEYEPPTIPRGLFKNISMALEDQRNRLKIELNGFAFPDDKKLTDFTLETEGEPIRSIVITTWRSGSTFFGDILNALPGTFYHYEPLQDFSIVQVREEPKASKAIRNLKNLLNCNFGSMGEYLSYGRHHTYAFKRNRHLWGQCLEHPDLCWQPEFLTPFCKLFPLHSMKVVRLRLNIAARLLEDKELNVRLSYLVRDPRGTLASRKNCKWCHGRLDCDDAATVCRDLLSDFKAAQDLAKRFPNRFKVVRYEDLSLDTDGGSRDILQFYKLPFHKDVEDFLNSHTKRNKGKGQSTIRDSKSTPFHWLADLRFEEVNNIQQNCVEAMHVWGYKMIANETMLVPNFDPLLPYSL